METPAPRRRRRRLGEEEKANGEGPSIAELHAKIGELTMENDFLSGALGRMGGTSVKR